MNILLIGNGFDLAHGLPTKYTDFLRWVVAECNFYEILKKQNAEIVQGISLKVDIPKDMIVNIQISARIEHQKELWGLINNNFWISHFLNNPMYQKENWIDFETEISEVIQSIDADLKNGNFSIESSASSITHFYVEHFFHDKLPGGILDFGKSVSRIISYKEIRDTLYRDLNNLIRAFEIYLCEYVQEIECSVMSPELQKIICEKDIDDEGKVIGVLPCKIISLNYTDTLRMIYDVQEHCKYDFVHGKADKNNTVETNNMVIGIDEYLSKKEKDKRIDFIAFKKYYQRIYKGTGCQYKEWVEEIRKNYMDYIRYEERVYNGQKVDTYFDNGRKKITNADYYFELRQKGLEKHHLYIFGHSLDITDKDILRDLILNDNIITTIFYNKTRYEDGSYDNGRKSLGEKIANLVKVIGQDELIKRTGGAKKTIEFKLQEDMVKRGEP